jgi:deoxycytidylate deaminase
MVPIRIGTMEVATRSINSTRHDRIMKILAKVAHSTGAITEFRLAAAIVFKNKIVSIGANEYKTHPLMARYTRKPENHYLHAEVSAIAKALNVLSLDDFKRSSLYVVRVSRSGEWALSKPCEGCTKAIIAFQIPRTIYSTNPGEYSEL